LVAPVPPIGLDQVGREDLAGVEGDDRDLLLVDDGEDPSAGGVEPAAIAYASAAISIRVVSRTNRTETPRPRPAKASPRNNGRGRRPACSAMNPVARAVRTTAP